MDRPSDEQLLALRGQKHGVVLVDEIIASRKRWAAVLKWLRDFEDAVDRAVAWRQSGGSTPEPDKAEFTLVHISVLMALARRLRTLTEILAWDGEDRKRKGT